MPRSLAKKKNKYHKKIAIKQIKKKFKLKKTNKIRNL